MKIHTKLVFLFAFFLMFLVVKTDAQAECGTYSAGMGVTICTKGNGDLITPFHQCGTSDQCCASRQECPLTPTPTPSSCGSYALAGSGGPVCIVNGVSISTYVRCNNAPATCCTSYTQSCTAIPTSVPQPTIDPNSGGQGGSGSNQTDPIVDKGFLRKVNPLTITGNTNLIAGVVQGAANMLAFRSPAGFLNLLLKVLFPLAGMILFIMIVWGGFEMMMGAADTKAQEAGKQRITAALIGFTMLFVSYWIAQIIQVVFGVNVLG